MKKLSEVRTELDAIDRQMAALYEKRLALTEEVVRCKLEEHLPVFVPEREKQVLERNAGYIKEERFRDKYLAFMQYVMDAGKEYQQSLMAREIVGYAGVEGAFSHMAAEGLFPHNPKLNFSNFEDVFKAVADRRIEYGVIPLENTNSGLVGEVVDYLHQYPVYINEVSDLTVEQCLLGVPGSTMKDIEWVYSKDQALMQAKSFIKGLGAEPVPYPNTALAAQYVARLQDKSRGAIAARENAELYGLEVLAPHIEENSENKTRFLVISLHDNSAGERFALSVSLSHQVGSLSRLLEALSENGLNMCSIQSRPRKGHPFEYMFFIELDNITDQAQAETCLQTIAPLCDGLKSLGLYSLRKEEE